MHGSRVARQPGHLQAMLTGQATLPRNKYPEALTKALHPKSHDVGWQFPLLHRLTIMDFKRSWFRLQPGQGPDGKPPGHSFSSVPAADTAPLQHCTSLAQLCMVWCQWAFTALLTSGKGKCVFKAIYLKPQGSMSFGWDLE